MEDSPQIETLMLADYAEVVAGKLYVMGGAWDRLAVRDPAQPIRLAIALGILVPWNGTNQTHELQLTIEDADSVSHGTLVQTTFVAGRPPDLKPGSNQRVLLAVNSLMPASDPGEYAIVAAIDRAEHRRVAFTVIHPTS